MADLLRLAQEKKETADSARIKRRQKNCVRDFWFVAFVLFMAWRAGTGRWSAEHWRRIVSGRN